MTNKKASKLVIASIAFFACGLAFLLLQTDASVEEPTNPEVHERLKNVQSTLAGLNEAPAPSDSDRCAAPDAEHSVAAVMNIPYDFRYPQPQFELDLDYDGETLRRVVKEDLLPLRPWLETNLLYPREKLLASKLYLRVDGEIIAHPVAVDGCRRPPDMEQFAFVRAEVSQASDSSSVSLCGLTLSPQAAADGFWTPAARCTGIAHRVDDGFPVSGTPVVEHLQPGQHHTLQLELPVEDYGAPGPQFDSEHRVNRMVIGHCSSFEGEPVDYLGAQLRRVEDTAIQSETDTETVSKLLAGPMGSEVEVELELEDGTILVERMTRCPNQNDDWKHDPELSRQYTEFLLASTQRILENHERL